MKQYIATALLIVTAEMYSESVREGVRRTFHGEVVSGPIEVTEGAVLGAEDVADDAVVFRHDHEERLVERNKLQEKRVKKESQKKQQTKRKKDVRQERKDDRYHIREGFEEMGEGAHKVIHGTEHALVESIGDKD